MPYFVPDLPWQRVAMDVLQFKNRGYLVAVDYYSHFSELRLLTKKRAQDDISQLKDSGCLWRPVDTTVHAGLL